MIHYKEYRQSYVTQKLNLELCRCNYLPGESGHVPWVREIVEYGVVLSRLAEYLIDAQGGKLWRSDVDNIRVLYSLFLASHDVLHEVHSHGLVGRHVLVAVHGQQLK